ncbi:MAG TPA: 30S ribosomal protein S12 methylthiotransferase RimO [Mycobacteriales bacterium]|nr:30S ribosomal protein S12 methylthiotransferase RimO [Mycobacteriales bacterium]
MASPRSVALVTLGCARNEVDSEELAGRLAADGWAVVNEPGDAAAILVNTCGFIAAAKKDSIDAVLEASVLGDARVVAVGCLAERYGADLARALPEATVLGFDDYPRIGERLRDIVEGRPHTPHIPRDRRWLLPLAPADPVPDRVPDGAPDATADAATPPYTHVPRRRLTSAVAAPLKLASGCDRRCAFCAIPSFRGSFVSRHPERVLGEARWLAAQGVRELVLVSENSTSYGKDLGDLRLLERLLPELVAVPGIARVRVTYLQPAELHPSLVDVIAGTGGVAPYFDLSFQHASAPVLRRMRRFGDRHRFLELLERVRDADPLAGARSNVIVGFPGEIRGDVTELVRFLEAARLDAVGVFAYSDEDGTEAATLPGKVRRDTVRRRVDRIGGLVEELTAQRAEERLGTTVDVLVEALHPDGRAEGRAAHQAPEVDGTTSVHGGGVRVGDLVRARVVATEGVDLVADAVEILDRAATPAAASPLSSPLAVPLAGAG